MHYCIVKNCDYSEKIDVVEKNCVLVLILQICPSPFVGNKCYSSTCLRKNLSCRQGGWWCGPSISVVLGATQKSRGKVIDLHVWPGLQGREEHPDRLSVTVHLPVHSVLGIKWQGHEGNYLCLVQSLSVWSSTTTSHYTVTAWCFLQDRNRLIVQELFHVSELFKWWSSFGFYMGCGSGLFLCLWGTCCHNLQGDLI